MLITKGQWHWGGRPKKSANNDIIGQNGPQKNANLVMFKEKHTQTNAQETKKSLNNTRWTWPLNFSNYLALGEFKGLDSYAKLYFGLGLRKFLCKRFPLCVFPLDTL